MFEGSDAPLRTRNIDLRRGRGRFGIFRRVRRLVGSTWQISREEVLSNLHVKLPKHARAAANSHQARRPWQISGDALTWLLLHL